MPVEPSLPELPAPDARADIEAELRAGLSALAFCFLVWLAQFIYPDDVIHFALVSYLPFHTALETASLVLGTLAFALIWRVPASVRRAGLMTLAATVLAAAVLDFLHMLSYQGMPEMVTPSGPEKAIAFWLGSRGLVTLGLLAAAWMPPHAAVGRGARHAVLAASLGSVLLFMLLVLLRPHWLPRTFEPGVGLTDFKVGVEWGLVLALALAAGRLLWLARRAPWRAVVMLGMAAAFAALGELCFASYSAVSDSVNLLGHVCKIATCWYLTRVGYALAVQQPLRNLGGLADALQATMNPSLICDPQGQVRWVNRAFETVTGYTAAEVVGRSIAMLSLDPQACAAQQTLAAIRRGEAWQGQVQVRRRDGSSYLDERSVTPIRNARGRVTSHVIVGDDVTERMRVAREAQETAERLRVLLQSAPDGVVVIDAQGKIEIANRRVEQMFGYSADELVGSSVNLLMPADLAAQHDGHIARHLATGQGRIIGRGRDVIGRHRDGSPLNLHLTIGEAPLPSGRVYIGFVRDISERLRAQAELAEREQRYRALMDTAADGVWIVDVEGRFVAVNDAYLRVSGYAREELMQMRVADVEAGDGNADVANHLARVVEQGHAVFESMHRTRDGRLWPVEVSASYWPLGQVQFFVFLRDLSQRKAAERALRLSEERFALALRGTNDGLWDRNLLDDSTYYSPRWKEMLGYREHELDSSRATFARLLHPDDALRVQLTLADVVGGHGGDRFEIEMRLRHKQGHWVHVLSRGQLVRDDAGWPVRLIGTHQDLSERKAAEQALRESETKLRRLFELSPLGIALCGFDGAILDHNEAYARLTGYTAEQLRRLSFWELSPPEFRAAQRMQLESLAAHGQFGPFEKEYLRPDGSRLPVRLNAVRLDIDGRPHVWAIVEDLTETRRVEAERQALQKQQMHSQKLEALGHLTGGVAHDFNNMLAGIMGLASLGLERHVADPDSKLARYLHEIVRTSERGRDLVAKMLSFARTEQPAAVLPHDVGPVVTELREMLASSLPGGIGLHCEVEPGLPPVRITPVDVHQIVMNLVFNARDAVGERGRIELAVRQRRLAGAVCANCGEMATGPHVMIEVRDDGCGIPPAVLPKVFDPFFTTKEVGEGTGLGLPSVLGIVHKCGGHVQIDSTPGAGSTLRILLPAETGTSTPPGPAPAPARAAGSPAPHPAGAPVWVVDDDAAVLVYLSEYLQEHGFSVRAFADPLEALQRLRQAGRPPLALVTDQTMPGLAGVELATQALARHPGLGVVLCTGYSEQVDAATARALGIRHFLRKPFESHRLIEALTAELQAPRG